MPAANNTFLRHFTPANQQQDKQRRNRKLESALIKEYSIRDDIPLFKLIISDIIDKNKADYPVLSVSDIIKQQQAVPILLFSDRLRIISDMTVDLSDSHHYICMIDNHCGPQPMTDMLSADMSGLKYNLTYDCKTTDRHVCVYERRGV